MSVTQLKEGKKSDCIMLVFLEYAPRFETTQPFIFVPVAYLNLMQQIKSGQPHV